MSCGEFTPDLLAHRWKWHLRRKFGAPAAVSEAFGCSHRAAEYWLAGEQIPRCFVMMRYLNDHPEARAEIYGDAP